MVTGAQGGNARQQVAALPNADAGKSLLRVQVPGMASNATGCAPLPLIGHFNDTRTVFIRHRQADHVPGGHPILAGVRMSEDSGAAPCTTRTVTNA